MQDKEISTVERHTLTHALFSNLRRMLFKCPTNTFLDRLAELHRISDDWACACIPEVSPCITADNGTELCDLAVVLKSELNNPVEKLYSHETNHATNTQINGKTVDDGSPSNIRATEEDHKSVCSEATVVDNNAEDEDDYDASDVDNTDKDSDYQVPSKKKKSSRLSRSNFPRNLCRGSTAALVNSKKSGSSSFRVSVPLRRLQLVGVPPRQTRSSARSFSNPFPCTHCHVRLKTRFLLNRHIREYHSVNAGPRNCPMCNQRVSSYRRLAEHIKTNHTQREPKHVDTVHQCPMCAVTTTSIIDLSQHLLNFHGEDGPNNPPTEMKREIVPDAPTAKRRPGRPRKVPIVTPQPARTVQDENPDCQVTDREVELGNNKDAEASGDSKKTKNDAYDTPMGKAVYGNTSERPKRGRPRKYEADVLTDNSTTRDTSLDETGNQFHCPQCDRVLKTRMILNRHIREYHSVDAGPRSCPLCPKVLTSSRRLVEHIKCRHSEDERNIDQVHCPICKRVMPAVLLPDHVAQCQYAPKPAKVGSGSASKHLPAGRVGGNVLKIKAENVPDGSLSQSTPELPAGGFSCMLCDSRLKTKCLLRRHIREYHSSSAGPRACPMCMKIFTSARRLTEHLKCRHAADLASAGQHCCAICARVFLSELGLSLHTKICHRTQTSCTMCDAKLDGKSLLVQHMKDQHGLKYVCPLCNKEVGSEIVLRKHIKMHGNNGVRERIVCEICANTFASANSLKYHMLFKHSSQRDFACKQCAQTFKVKEMLTRHIVHVHGKVREHLCSMCGRAFAQKHQLKTHMRVHRNDERRIDLPGSSATNTSETITKVIGSIKLVPPSDTPEVTSILGLNSNPKTPTVEAAETSYSMLLAPQFATLISNSNIAASEDPPPSSLASPNYPHNIKSTVNNALPLLSVSYVSPRTSDITESLPTNLGLTILNPPPGYDIVASQSGFMLADTLFVTSPSNHTSNETLSTNLTAIVKSSNVIV